MHSSMNACTVHFGLNIGCVLCAAECEVLQLQLLEMVQQHQRLQRQGQLANGSSNHDTACVEDGAPEALAVGAAEAAQRRDVRSDSDASDGSRFRALQEENDRLQSELYAMRRLAEQRHDEYVRFCAMVNEIQKMDEPARSSAFARGTASD